MVEVSSERVCRELRFKLLLCPPRYISIRNDSTSLQINASVKSCTCVDCIYQTAHHGYAYIRVHHDHECKNDEYATTSIYYKLGIHTAKSIYNKYLHSV